MQRVGCSREPSKPGPSRLENRTRVRQTAAQDSRFRTIYNPDLQEVSMKRILRRGGPIYAALLFGAAAIVWYGGAMSWLDDIPSSISGLGFVVVSAIFAEAITR